MANYNELLFGLGGYLDAMQPRYAVGQIPQAPSPFAQTAQGMMSGRKLDQSQQLRDIVKQKGWAGLMDDPEATGLMAEMDPQGFMRGLIAQQVAKEKAGLLSGIDPSNVREWQYYNSLSKEDQERYLTMKRANQVKDFGPYIGVVPQVNPGAGPTVVGQKGLAPEDLPSTRGAQATAAAEGKVIGETRGTERKQAVDAGKMLDLTEGVEEVIKQSTGSGIGTMVDSLGRFFGKATDGAVAGGTLKALQSSLLRFIPRLEGPQSDADRKAYEQAVGSLGDTTLTRAERLAALAEVRRIMQKYQFYGDTFVPGAGTTGDYAPVSPGPAVSGKSSTGVNWKIK